MASDKDPFEGAERPGEESNPLAEFMAQFGIRPGADGNYDLGELMGHLQAAMGQMGAQMAAFGGGDDGLNWSFVRDVARKVTASQGADPSTTPAETAAVRDAVGLADLWLDRQTSFGRVSAPAAAWSRAEWVEHTFADQVLSAMRRTGSSLAELTQDLHMLPQVLVNCRLAPGFDWTRQKPLIEAREEVEKILEGRGRVLIRPSGTEPLLRIMVESEDREEAQTLAERIASTIK